MKRRVKDRFDAALRSVGIYDGIGIKPGHPIATPLYFISVVVCLSCFVTAVGICLQISPAMTSTGLWIAFGGMAASFASTICCYMVAGAPSLPEMEIGPARILAEREERLLAHLRGEAN